MCCLTQLCMCTNDLSCFNRTDSEVSQWKKKKKKITVLIDFR